MDPLSLTVSALTILQAAGAAGKGIHKLLSLKDAPQQLQQLSNEAEALRGELQSCPLAPFLARWHKRTDILRSSSAGDGMEPSSQK